VIVHICPVCGNAHEIPEILHSLACGRQLTCSPQCKRCWPAIIRARTLAGAVKTGTQAPRTVERRTERPRPGIIGEPRVHVPRVNLAAGAGSA